MGCKFELFWQFFCKYLAVSYLFKPLKKEHKGIKKWLKISIIIIAAITSMSFGAYYMLITRPVQNLIGQRLLMELSKRTDTKFRASQVSFSQFRELEITDLYIEDKNNDTLLYAPRAYAELDSMNRNTRFVSLSVLQLTQPYINISQDADSVLNFMFLVDSLYNPDKPDSLRWKVNFNDVALEGGDFDVALLNKENVEFLSFDLETHIAPGKINLEKLNFKLLNGFDLQQASGHMQIADDGLQLSNFSATTANSFLMLRKVALYADGKPLRAASTDEWQLSLQSNNSIVSGQDLAFFLPQKYVVDKTLLVDGKIEGRMDELTGQNLHLRVDSTLDVRFDLALNQLTHIDSLNYNLNFHNLELDVVELAVLYNTLSPESTFDYSPYRHWGAISYEGEVDGGLKNISSVGVVKTHYGKLKNNLRVSFDDSLKFLAYEGDLSTYAFQLGKALQTSEILGRASGRFHLQGQRDGNGDLEHYFKGQVSKIGIQDYNYQNIALEGGVDRRYFNGILTVDDPNAELDFSGEVDFYSAEPKFNFTLDLHKMDLAHAKLVDSYEQLNLQLHLDSKLSGDKVDNLNGYMTIDSLTVNTEYGQFITDSIQFSFKPLDAMPSIVLSSEYVNGLILGSYNFSEILGYFNTSLKKHMKHIPRVFVKPKSDVENDFSFAFEISDMKALASVLDMPLRANGFSVLSGVIDAPADYYELEADVPYLLTREQLLDSISIRVNNSPRQMNSHVLVNQFTFGGDHVMDNINFNLNVADDTARIYTHWENDDLEEYRGDFNANLWLQPYGRDMEVIMEVMPSEFVFADTLWHLNHHQIAMREKHITIDSLIFNHTDSYFALDGIASTKISDTLRFEVNDFDLKDVSRFLSVHNFTFGGKMSGQAELYRVLEEPILISDLLVADMVLNESALGDFTAVSEWKGELKELRLLVDCVAPQDGSTLIGALGAYYPSSDSLDIDVDLEGFDIQFLQPYLERTMTGLQGRGFGHLQVSGPMSAPELYGAVKVDQGQFHIDYLSTDFYINDSIYFDKNRFVFENTMIQDQEGNYGFVTGEVVHTGYKNMLANILIESDRLMALNTDASENEYFFGDVYFGGAVTIQTTEKQTLIGSSARTMNGSFLTVPLTPISTASTNNFITYKKPEELVEEVGLSSLITMAEEVYPTKHLIVDMNFDVTPEALLRLEFDPQSGEVIEAAGKGNLNIKFEQGQPFQLFGEYEIERGDYLFTIQQVFNKRFDIVSGSTLQWSGKPGDAMMDITAQYQARASLYNLMPDAISESSKNRRVPVNVMLYLKRRLSQPDIAFDIELPNTDEETQQSVSSIIDTEEEMSRQVLSLLIMNSFYTPEYYTDANDSETNEQFASGAAVTVSEFMSNQLSNWMSQISDNFDLGVRWTPEQEVVGEGLSPDEYQVIISTQLFDDRLTVNGNVGYQDYAAEARPPNVNSNFVGEVDVELKISESIKLKAYSHQNDDILYENSNMKQGAGIAYEKEFTTLKDWLFKRKDKRAMDAILKEEEDDIEEDRDSESSPDSYDDKNINADSLMVN